MAAAKKTQVAKETATEKTPNRIRLSTKNTLNNASPLAKLPEETGLSLFSGLLLFKVYSFPCMHAYFPYAKLHWIYYSIARVNLQ